MNIGPNPCPSPQHVCPSDSPGFSFLPTSHLKKTMSHWVGQAKTFSFNSPGEQLNQLQSVKVVFLSHHILKLVVINRAFIWKWENDFYQAAAYDGYTLTKHCVVAQIAPVLQFDSRPEPELEWHPEISPQPQPLTLIYPRAEYLC